MSRIDLKTLENGLGERDRPDWVPIESWLRAFAIASQTIKWPQIRLLAGLRSPAPTRVDRSRDLISSSLDSTVAGNGPD